MSERANRDHWNATSDRYQAGHGEQLGAAPKAWGAWSVPESEVNAIGDLAGLRVLELGCGAGQWSAALADDGVDITGLDLSERQLSAARGHVRSTYPLVQGAAESIPFADATFDLVFCDHGGLSWGDPYRVVPEVARVLSAGGRLVFSAASPFIAACYDEDTDQISTSLQRPYFDLYALAEGDSSTSYVLPYGEWVRVFRRSGLIVEDLIEPRPAATAATSYYGLERSDWAHLWPADVLWIVRRPPG